MGGLLHVHDPGHLSLRRAARVAVVVPIAVALGLEVIGDAQVALFAAFGSFAALAFAHFGGPPLPRMRAYAVTMLVGAVLVLLGTAVTDQLVLAAVLAFAVGMAVRLAGTFGGYVEAAALPLILAYVLAATVDVPFDEVDSRLIGWLGAGTIVIVSSVALWPSYERTKLARSGADACRALATAARDPERVPDALDAVERFRQVAAHTPNRPAGPTAHDRALMLVIDQIYRLGTYIQAVASAEDRDLAEQVAITLDATAERLEGGRSRPQPDVLSLDRARAAHRQALGAQIESALDAGAAVDEMVDRLDSSFGPRLASYAALSVASNAVVLTGGRLPPSEQFEFPPDAPPPPSAAATIRDGAAEIRAQLRTASPRLQDAVRAGAGIAIAVFVAIAAALGHAFWVVLGTLAVLRSNAAATGTTAVEAILGTAAGFVVGSALVLAIGTGPTALWIALPITAFLAGYAPTAIHFVVGQAAFTVFVVVLFNLMEPTGWEVGLVRVEDVAIGAGVSLLVGLLIWPRGGREALRRSAAIAYRLAGRYLDDGLRPVVKGTSERPPFDADRADLDDAMRRTIDALHQHFGEPGRKLSEQTCTQVVVGPRHVQTAGDSLRMIEQRFLPAGYPGTPELTGPASRLVGRYGSFANALETGSGNGARSRTPDEDPMTLMRARVCTALEDCRGEPDAQARQAALGLAWTRDWMLMLQRFADDLEEPVAEIAATAATPWWRR